MTTPELAYRALEHLLELPNSVHWRQEKQAVKAVAWGHIYSKSYIHSQIKPEPDHSASNVELTIGGPGLRWAGLWVFTFGELRSPHLPLTWAHFRFQQLNLLIAFKQKEELNVHSAKTEMPLLAWTFKHSNKLYHELLLPDDPTCELRVHSGGVSV